ncbi:MAG: flavin reductase [Clostridia bacterium]|nr:flavin reductase [Clostridia bacterium]
MQDTRNVARQGENAAEVDNKAMFALSYGLFVLSAKDGEKDNACIINTVTQITSTPNRISIAVNKQNFTHDIIKKTGMFNASILTERAPFAIFERFGFASGRDKDKFAGFPSVARSQNGLLYITDCANAFLSAKVIDAYDYGTHTLFIADMTEGKVLNADPSITYAYYFAHTKPRPKPAEKKVKGFVCKICGYVYEGDTLPVDFVCPLCKHGAADFEPLT